jgi:DNA-binding PadR family transcriptional regulator
MKEDVGRVTKLLLEVLLALAQEPDEPLHGFAIAAKTDNKPQSVYPALNRLERAGWVRAGWEPSATEGRPNKRVYSLTPDGRSKALALLEARGFPQSAPAFPSSSKRRPSGHALPGAAS